MYTWAALNDNAKWAKILWTITEPCLNPEFPQEQLKNYHSLKIFVFLRGLMTWLVMQRSVWNDIVSWQTRRSWGSSPTWAHNLWGVWRSRKWPRSPSWSRTGGWTWTSRWTLRWTSGRAGSGTVRRGRKRRTQGRRPTTQDTNHKCACAACSELRVVRVRVRDGVLVIHRSVLKRDVVMREGVRNAVAIIVYRKCSWIWGAGFIPFTTLGQHRSRSSCGLAVFFPWFFGRRSTQSFDHTTSPLQLHHRSITVSRVASGRPRPGDDDKFNAHDVVHVGGFTRTPVAQKCSKNPFSRCATCNNYGYSLS